MASDEIAAAHRRMVEQVMSDERLLGLLPDDLTRMVLDWTIAHLDGARARAASVDGYHAEADAIRAEARRIAEAAAAAEDDAAALAARLSRVAAPAGGRRGGEDEAVSAASTATGVTRSAPSLPVDASLTAALRRTLDRFRAFFRGGSR